MKKQLATTVIASLLMLSFTVKSQTTFSPSELEKLCNYSTQEFETYVLKRGYSLHQNTNYDDGVISTMFFSEERRQYDTPDMMTRTYSETFVLLVFATTSKDYYLGLKQALSEQGYTFQKEYGKDVSGKTCIAYDYGKGEYTVTLYSDTINGITWYTLQIFEV